MSAKFTPGPWRAVDGQGQYANEVHFTTPRGLSKAVARVASGIANRDADARLIAAAPELYEALSELLAWWPDPAGPHADKMDRAEEMARAALAKV